MSTVEMSVSLDLAPGLLDSVTDRLVFLPPVEPLS